MIAFVQPFGLDSPGGSSRIFRALLEGDHPPALSISTEAKAPPPSKSIEELHLPVRPALGRLERTRFRKHFLPLEGIFRSSFEARLHKTIEERGIRAFHLLAHGYDLVGVWNVASKYKIPLILDVHDDLKYVAMGHPRLEEMLTTLGEIWRKADQIVVISDEIGQEYSKRYGKREYEPITDGLTDVAPSPLSRPGKSLRVYFMGLFHYKYRANLRALLDALKLIRASHPDWDVSMTCRCGSIFDQPAPDDVPVTVLPFAPESQVAKDMLSADLLYQPLPFEAEVSTFGKFSLSTKLVTYLGSGLPILYHGPADAAAANLLTTRKAGFVCTTLDPETIAREILESADRRDAIVNNALALGRERFMLADQQKRFWAVVNKALQAQSR
jgi:glycosyltransferase involved in cell wall biosynthesis